MRDLKPYVAARRADLLQEEQAANRFSPCCPASSAERTVWRLVPHEVRQDGRLQHVEHLRVPKKAGDVDVQILCKLVELRRVAPEQVEVAVECCALDRRHGHAALDSPPQGARLVQREVLPGPRAQKRDDVGRQSRSAVARQRTRCRTQERARNLGDRQTRSTAPVAIAARGKPSNAASFGSCAMTRPPPACTAGAPRLPSVPLPERMSQMAKRTYAAASECSRESNGRRAP